MPQNIPGFLGPFPHKQGTGTGVTSPPPTSTGYVLIQHLTYTSLRPFQVGQATPIPSNTKGNIGQRVFDKIRQSVPVAKAVIRKQLQLPS